MFHCRNWKQALNNLETLDRNRVILFNRDLNTGKGYVRVLRVVEDRISGRKVACFRYQMQRLSILSRADDFRDTSLFPKVSTTNGSTIGPYLCLGVGQRTYRK